MAKTLKTYPAPWKGQLILACRKCQKKLKNDPSLQALAKLKKTIKRRNKTSPGPLLSVLNVPCMDVCPRNGVTICNPVRDAGRISILRSEKEIEELFDETE